MNDKKYINLVLFFTRGISLLQWDKIGIFEREVALYKRIQGEGIDVTFVTYGDAQELSYAKRLPGIRILCNRWGLPLKHYEKLLIILHSWHLLRADVFKTNQTNGADIALHAARIYHKPLIARCGYMWSYFVSHEYGDDSELKQRAQKIEKQVFTNADRVVVTTRQMKQHIMEKYGVTNSKVEIIPNYVQTDVFRPNKNDTLRQGHILFIGRLEYQKNLFALFEAIQGLDVELNIVGDGSQRKDLEKLALENKINVQFLGNRPHTELPQYFNKAEIFILPSLYEGHPKALLEAMSCGVPVIGTNVPGIRELICHRETGYLCGTSPSEIRTAIQEVLSDKKLQIKLGENARKFVVYNFSIERILDMELKLIKELTIGKKE